MSNKFKHDEEILVKIKKGNSQIVNDLFSSLKSSFIKYFIGKDMSEENATDIYYKAFTIFYQNTMAGKIKPPLESTINTYLHGIGKNLMMQFRTGSKKNQTEPIEGAINMTNNIQEPGIYDFYYHQANKELVKRLLLALDERCKKILELSFIKGYSDNAIMHELELPNENAVRQQKFRCLVKIRKLIK